MRAEQVQPRLEWSAAIERAKTELAKAEDRVRRLKVAIRVFERNKAEGLDLETIGTADG